MHLQPALLIPILAIGVLANPPIRKDGLGSYLRLAELEAGTRVAAEVTGGCIQTNKAGEQITGKECLKNAILYMIQALRDAQGVMEVALLSNTVDNTIAYKSFVNVTSAASSSSFESIEPTSTIEPPANIEPTATTLPLKLKRQDESAREALLVYLNDQIARRSHDRHEPRAVHIGHSELHPTDGLAARTNVRSGDATLHVHTNGSHITAAFTKDSIQPLGRREATFTSEPEYRFNGAQGIKMQLRSGDEKGYNDLIELLYVWAFGENGKRPDAVSFALCEDSTDGLKLQGKLVFEDYGAGDEWEEQGLIGCGV
jgi:hypothetical protein